MARGIKDVFRRKRMLELRLNGLGYRDIARAMGYRNPGFVYRVVKAELREVTAEPARELRQLELDRLDRLQLSAWPAAMAGDPKATLAVLKIMEHRAKLLGLVPAPPPTSEVLQEQALGGVLVIQGTALPPQDQQKALPAPEPDD